MTEKVYYYKDADGKFHFSTGVVRDDAKAGEYLRMLRYSKRVVERLFLDIPDDFRVIKRMFSIQDGVSWQDVFYQKTT